MRSNHELIDSYGKRGEPPALHADSMSADFAMQPPEAISGLAENALSTASEASLGEFMAALPPELEILIGKDADDALYDYGYPDRRITELGFPKSPTLIRRSPRASASSRKPKRMLPPGLERLSYEEVERILDDDGYTKRQIAELGFRRFGIPEKSLIHSRKYDAVTSVRDAVANERILDAISRQARKAGRMRTA